jgi:hypothetical protein
VSEARQPPPRASAARPPTFVRVLDVVSLAAFLTFLASALVLIVLWVRALVGWLGWLGLPLGIVGAPLAVAFPFVHRAVEGSFPVLGLWVWIASVWGVAVSMAWRLLRPEDARRSPRRDRSEHPTRS